jgi:DNA-binding NtrC family response regulator
MPPTNTSDQHPHRVLIIDDDPIVADALAGFLRAEGYAPTTAMSAGEAMSALESAEKGSPTQAARPFAACICDVSMPGTNGLDLLERIVKEHPGTSVLMLTGYGTIEDAVRAVRTGACDYLTKPVLDSELRLALERALRLHTLAQENQTLKKQLDTRFSLDAIVGSDARMLRIYDLIEAVAPTKTTVLMSGESGVGKSMIAHAIHQHSPRKAKPYVELACGSIPETLLESELFGHVKGSFTGAHADKVGKFLAADGGTLFLDEINSASPGMQLKLLRVLQEKRFEPVGSNQTIEVDVRVILASNQSLEDLVAQGRFRQDLYYRINVVKIELPSLRERVSDIPALVEHFIQLHSAAMGKAIAGITPEAMELLRRYAYPGNVRELGNIIERACVLTRTPTIKPEDLPPHVVSPVSVSASASAPAAALRAAVQDAALASAPVAPATTDLEAAMREPEKQIILAALRSTGWNRLKAAEQLKINRTTLYKKMKLLGIDPARDAVAG